LWISNVSLLKFRSYWSLCLCLPVFNDPERLCIPIYGKMLYNKIGMHNRSGALKTGKQRHSDQTMVGSSLPPIVCKKAHVLLTLFVFACRKWCPTHIVLGFFLFVFVFSLCLVWPVLPVSLDCPFYVTSSVFSIIYWL
jgi:hypothetical protein